MNVIHLIGRIATDLKIETTTTGKNVCNFNLAVNRIANNTTDFIPCRVWNTTADNLCRYKNKGEQIALEGSLVCSSYTDKDGQNKKSIYVLVNNIEYVGNKNQQENTTYETNEAIASYTNQVEEKSVEVNPIDDYSSDEIQLSADDLPF